MSSVDPDVVDYRLTSFTWCANHFYELQGSVHRDAESSFETRLFTENYWMNLVQKPMNQRHFMMII